MVVVGREECEDDDGGGCDDNVVGREECVDVDGGGCDDDVVGREECEVVDGGGEEVGFNVGTPLEEGGGTK